jgi:lipopolysaccharide/colanic/teichoic acid biosynthesis glycosyltransferase
MSISPTGRGSCGEEPQRLPDDRSPSNHVSRDKPPDGSGADGPLDDLARLNTGRTAARPTFRAKQPPGLQPIFTASGSDALASIDATQLVAKWAADSRLRRATDLAVDALLAPATLTLLAGAGIALALEGKVGTVRFDSARVGMNHELFLMHKLRTLLGGDQSDSSSGAHDPRATKVGAFLRTYIIDEMLTLPTNVVKGQMQLVAHRPLVPEDLEIMSERLRPEDNRIWHAVYGAEPPGFLSAFGNLSPFLEEESDEYLRARAVLDVWQAINAGPALSRRIVADTVRIGLGKIKDPSQLAGYRETHGARSLTLAA